MVVLTLTVESGSRSPEIAGTEVGAWRDDGGGIFARAFVHDESRWIDWPGLGIFAFAATSTTVSVWPAAGVDRRRIVNTFARVLQPLILQGLGQRQALHASAVMGVAGAIAFCGHGGAGKSTVAYALGQSGFRQIADDALVIEVAGPMIRAHPLPFAAQLREPSREHFRDRPDGYHDTFEQSADPARPAALRAVFVLRQEPALPRLLPPERLKPVQAFSVLLTHAHCFDETDPLATRQLIEDYLHIAEQVPVLAIGYAPDFRQLSQLTDMIGETAIELDEANGTAV